MRRKCQAYRNRRVELDLDLDKEPSHLDRSSCLQVSHAISYPTHPVSNPSVFGVFVCHSVICSCLVRLNPDHPAVLSIGTWGPSEPHRQQKPPIYEMSADCRKTAVLIKLDSGF